MHPIGRFLMSLGVMLFVIGIFWQFGSQWGLGQLPGDLSLRRGNMEVHIPVVTCLIISGAISLLLYIFRLFK